MADAALPARGLMPALVEVGRPKLMTFLKSAMAKCLSRFCSAVANLTKQEGRQTFLTIVPTSA